jgi:hypothetical protein
MPEVKPDTDFKWPVGFEKVIAAPAQAVWQVISRRGNLEFCHPFCLRNPVHVWPGPQSRDEVHYLNGLVYARQFKEWFDGVGYDLEISGKGSNKSQVSWRITPEDDRQCALRITVFPQALQNWPTFLRWIPHMRWLRPNLRSYLESVVKGVEWNVIRGEPVPRNAFGTHPWFSAAG